jgi:hypothetical protein
MEPGEGRSIPRVRDSEHLRDHGYTRAVPPYTRQMVKSTVGKLVLTMDLR